MNFYCQIYETTEAKMQHKKLTNIVEDLHLF